MIRGVYIMVSKLKLLPIDGSHWNASNFHRNLPSNFVNWSMIRVFYSSALHRSRIDKNKMGVPFTALKKSYYFPKSSYLFRDICSSFQNAPDLGATPLIGIVRLKL